MSKPNKQDDAAKRIGSAGLDSFNPKIRQYSKKRQNYIVQDLFPLYFFVEFDAEKHYKMIKFTRGVLRVLGTGNTPISIDKEIINKIRNNCDDNNIVEAKYFEEDIKEGTAITITDGPFAGIDAIVTGLLNDQQRVEILMNLMKISINKIQIKKK